MKGGGGNACESGFNNGTVLAYASDGTLLDSRVIDPTIIELCMDIVPASGLCIPEGSECCALSSDA